MDILYQYYLASLEKFGVDNALSIVLWYIFPFLLACCAFFVISSFLKWIEKKIYKLIKNKVQINAIEELSISNFKNGKLAFILIMGPSIYLWGLIPYSNKYIPVSINTSTLIILSILMFLLYSFLLLGKDNEYKKTEAKIVIAILSFLPPILISLLSVVLSTASLDLNEIILAQSKMQNSSGWLITPLILGFFVFVSGIICILTLLEKKLKISNFALLKISNSRINFLLLSYYSLIFMFCAYCVCLFLGGYLPPLGFYIGELYQIHYVLNTSVVYVEQIFWLFFKTLLLAIFIIGFKIRFAEIKKRKLVNFAWYVLFPVSIINLIISLVAPLLGGN